MQVSYFTVMNCTSSVPSCSTHIITLKSQNAEGVHCQHLISVPSLRRGLSRSMSAPSGRLSDKEKKEHYLDHIQKTKRIRKIEDVWNVFVRLRSLKKRG